MFVLLSHTEKYAKHAAAKAYKTQQNQIQNAVYRAKIPQKVHESNKDNNTIYNIDDQTVKTQFYARTTSHI